MIVSLDGFIAGPERDLDWMISPDPEREAEHLRFLDSVDTMLVGHGVYHDMVGYWPTATGRARRPHQRDAEARRLHDGRGAGLAERPAG